MRHTMSVGVPSANTPVRLPPYRKLQHPWHGLDTSHQPQSIYTCHTRDDKTTPRELRCATTASHLFHKGIPELGAQVDATIMSTRSTQQSRDHIPACAIPSRSRLCEATMNQNCGPVYIYITLAEDMLPPQRASIQNMHSGNPICHRTFSQNNTTR